MGLMEPALRLCIIENSSSIWDVGEVSTSSPRLHDMSQGASEVRRHWCGGLEVPTFQVAQSDLATMQEEPWAPIRLVMRTLAGLTFLEAVLGAI